MCECYPCSWEWLIWFVSYFEGKYLIDYCSKDKKTVCSPCKEGFYADKHNAFDKCEKCQACQQGKIEIKDKRFDLEKKWLPCSLRISITHQLVLTMLLIQGIKDKTHIWKSCGFNSCLSTDYTEKCTATTNTNCSCRVGFLCLNNVCSKCEENKCVSGEKPKRTGENGQTFKVQRNKLWF